MRQVKLFISSSWYHLDRFWPAPPDGAGAVRRGAEERGGPGGGDPLLHVGQLALVPAQLPADEAEEEAGQEHAEPEHHEDGAHHLRRRAHSLKC